MGLLKKRETYIGLSIGFILTACAGQFPYHPYGLSLESQKLRGPEASNDRDLGECLATSTDKSPCTVFFTDEYLRLRADYVDKENQLIACQHKLAAANLQ